MHYLNISAYKFVTLPSVTLSTLQNTLKQQALTLALKGTILLSTEGINLFLAGEPKAIHQFTVELIKIPAFTDLWFKYNESEIIPFKRLLVRIKSEIIAMHQPEIQPEKQTAPYLEPEQLKQWYEQNVDMVVLDTRNQYEVTVGTFAQAIHCNIAHFNEFPQAVAVLSPSLKSKPVVTFCTGGIRCEKAAAYLLTQGFKNVWQLKGGILNYFTQCGDQYFSGDCFVFDDRGVVKGSSPAHIITHK